MPIGETFMGEEEFIDFQKHFGTQESVVTDFIKYDPPEMRYSMANVPIGYTKRTESVFTLDLSKSRRILILGQAGSGKSTLSNCIMDRFIKAGGAMTIFDLKGEYIYKDKPLPDKFSKKILRAKDGTERPLYMLPQEKAQGFPISCYYPIFLQNLRKTATGKQKSLLASEKICQLGMSNLTKADFFTFFEQITAQNPRYYDILEELWAGIQDNGLYDWDAMIAFIKESGSFDKLSGKTLVRVLSIMRDNQILGDQFEEPALVEDIKNKKIGILDLQGLLELPSSVSPALVYVNIMMRRIYNAKVQNIIPKAVHNMIYIDEVNKFVPKLGETPAKREFLKSLDLVRSEHISMMYSTQDYNRIPQTLIEQSDYVFIPYNSSLDNMAEIIKMILPQEYQTPQTFKPKIAFLQSLMKKLPDGRRDWLCISKVDKKRDFFMPVLPLSYFLQEGEG